MGVIIVTNIHICPHTEELCNKDCDGKYIDDNSIDGYYKSNDDNDTYNMDYKCPKKKRRQKKNE